MLGHLRNTKGCYRKLLLKFEKIWGFRAYFASCSIKDFDEIFSRSLLWTTIAVHDYCKQADPGHHNQQRIDIKVALITVVSIVF